MAMAKLAVRYALRLNYKEAVAEMVSKLDDDLHLEFAFYVMKNIVSERNYEQFSILREFAMSMQEYTMPSYSQACTMLRIERAAAYVVRFQF